LTSFSFCITYLSFISFSSNLCVFLFYFLQKLTCLLIFVWPPSRLRYCFLLRLLIVLFELLHLCIFLRHFGQKLHCLLLFLLLSILFFFLEQFPLFFFLFYLYLTLFFRMLHLLNLLWLARICLALQYHARSQYDVGVNSGLKNFQLAQHQKDLSVSQKS